MSWVPSFLARHSAISKRALGHYCERLNTIVSNYSNLMGIIEVTDSMHATVVGSVRVRLLCDNGTVLGSVRVRLL